MVYHCSRAYPAEPHNMRLPHHKALERPDEDNLTHRDTIGVNSGINNVAYDKTLLMAKKSLKSFMQDSYFPLVS